MNAQQDRPLCGRCKCVVVCARRGPWHPPARPLIEKLGVSTLTERQYFGEREAPFDVDLSLCRQMICAGEEHGPAFCSLKAEHDGDCRGSVDVTRGGRTKTYFFREARPLASKRAAS